MVVFNSFNRLLFNESRWIGRVRAFADSMGAADEVKLKETHHYLKRLALTQRGKPQHANRLTIQAFGLMSELCRRTQGLVPYDVQLLAAAKLRKRQIVEMATGEGKSLTVLFPLYLSSLSQKGVMLATANDYLAQRDADYARSVFAPIGVTVGVVLDSSEDVQRREAYHADITFGTATQFGFDFLRDRAKQRFNQRNPGYVAEQTVHRSSGLFSIIVDEADSLLIDEAATPLLIASSPPEIPPEKEALYQWASQLSIQAQEPLHFQFNEIEQKASLTNDGKKWVYQNLGAANLQSASVVDCYEFVERAILVRRNFLNERDYLLSEDEVQLLERGTGRIGQGRQWSRGIHQAIQAKERLPLSAPNGELAKVTLQSFFLGFKHLSGLTGTASEAKREFAKTYKLSIQKVPTHRPCQRVALPELCLPDTQSWLSRIEQECREILAEGRSVLVGTRNVRLSEHIASHLTTAGLSVQLLNARNDANEAEIVSQAGQPGRITVATNMAGRGTDIRLHDSVKHCGGLHVILAGIHESRRIDRQLIGRAGRQGDPGSFRKILCLEDDLIDQAFTHQEVRDLREQLRADFQSSACYSNFVEAQRIMTRRATVMRDSLFHQEKKQFKLLRRAGLDPLLDVPG